MHVYRHYTKPNQDPYAEIEFCRAKSEIRNPDGSMVFSLDEVEVPLDWSQVATDILAQKYFRRAGVPARLRRVEEQGVPSFLWRSEAGTAELASLPAAARYGSEHSAIQVFDRLAGAWTYWGWKHGYFDVFEDAQAFFDELPLHARAADRGTQLTAMVQHRPPLVLWHRLPQQGPLLRRS